MGAVTRLGFDCVGFDYSPPLLKGSAPGRCQRRFGAGG